MTRWKPAHDDHAWDAGSRPSSAIVRDLAEADHQSVISLIQELVRVPTRGGLDHYEPLIDLVEKWLDGRGLQTRKLQDRTTQSTVGVVCDVTGSRAGPRYILDACLDTAPFGEEAAWLHGPTSGEIEGGWLYGRGAADSKAAIAIFMHIAAHVHRHAAELNGTLTLLFDADEHTGRFGGAKRYFVGVDAPTDVRGVMIGYPGISQLVVGGRGFLRAQLTARGKAGHTGSQRSSENDNAVERAAQLVRALSEHRTPGPVDATLKLSPKLTVTRIIGGESFSIIPDNCTVDVDVRLTNSFDEGAARHLIEAVCAKVDRERPLNERTTVVFLESWPAFLIDEDAPIRTALARSAAQQLPNAVAVKAAGPSNIGNYLAKLGIPATAGLGVRYEALHGTNERIDLATIPAIQATYHDAVLTLLTCVTGVTTTEQAR